MEDSNNQKDEAAVALGRRGGLKTREKLGSEHFRRIQVLSAKKRRKHAKNRPFAKLT